MNKRMVKQKRNIAMVSVEVDGHVIKLPRSAFEDGAHEISLSGETYVEIEDYVASVRASR
jgi:hypothetical protein